MIPYDEGFEFSKKHGLLYIECSAKTSKNIDPVFTLVAESILEKIEKKEIDVTNESLGIKLGALENEKAISKKQGCC